MATRRARVVAAMLGVLVGTLPTVLTGCGGEPGPGSPSATTTATPSQSSSASSSSSGTPSSTGTSAPSTSTPSTSTPSTSTTPSPVITGRVVTVLPTTRKVVALTFDGGSGHEAVDSVLRTLGREGVPATFFLTGRFTQDAPAYAVRLSAYGMLGNHTLTHPHLTTLSNSQIRSEVTTARSVILGVTGEDPRPLFRFPFGEYDSRTLSIVNGLGYVAVGWTVDTLGWKGASAGITTATVVTRVLAAAQPGEIVLMHLGAAPDGSTLDADALATVITRLRAAGYRFVDLRQLRD